MTRNTWNRAWLEEHAGVLGMPQAWRGVETQYIAASMKLVDSFEAQDILEQMLEGHKPPGPVDHAEKHYLLLSPFRYVPAHSSRFRSGGRPGLWYGSSSLEGACTEIAYWRHRFLADAQALAGETLTTELTFYVCAVDGLAINLMQPPWAGLSHLWRHPHDYSATHQVADAAADAGIEWIQYESVRAPSHAMAAVLTPHALRSSSRQVENSRQEWFCQTTAEKVLLRSKKGMNTLTWVPDAEDSGADPGENGLQPPAST